VIGDREFSSVVVRAARCCGDGPGPCGEIQGVVKVQTAEDVLSAAGCPGFGNQSATLEREFIGAEVIKDFVDDLNGYGYGVPVVLEENGGSWACGGGRNKRKLTTGTPDESIGVGDGRGRAPDPSYSVLGYSFGE